MAYEEFALLVETHKQLIAEQAARSLAAMKLPIYLHVTTAQIAQNYIQSLEVFAHYIRSNDLDGYREYVQQITIRQHQLGFSLQEMIATGDTLAAKIREMLERELPGAEQLDQKLNFNRRLNRLITFGQMSAVKNSVGD